MRAARSGTVLALPYICSNTMTGSLEPPCRNHIAGSARSLSGPRRESAYACKVEKETGNGSARAGVQPAAPGPEPGVRGRNGASPGTLDPGGPIGPPAVGRTERGACGDRSEG